MRRHAVTGNVCFGRSRVNDDGYLLLLVSVSTATGKTVSEMQDHVDKDLNDRFQK